MDITTLALLLFLATYALMILFQKWRYIVALLSACVFVILGIMPLGGLLGAVNWNVLLMLAGTMGSVALFIQSKMPNRIADALLKLCPNVMWVAVVMSLFAGVVSAFIDNVATVLMIAPVALAICKRLHISPVPMLISISVSSNLQGAATLVGDTTSILLGGYADLNFMEFFFVDGKLSIFWATELGALVTIPIICFLFRHNRQPVSSVSLTAVSDYFPSFLLLATIAGLILVSFLPEKPELTNGLLCACLCVIGVIRSCIRSRSLRPIGEIIKELDISTLLLLTGLFIVIESITRAGVIDLVSEKLVGIGGSSPFLMYTLIVWGSVVISAFVDNIPYVTTMLPVVSGIAAMMEVNPILFYFGLLVGATLGGNLTPIGASANIATIGILNRQGYDVPTRDFLRIGVPFTLAAVLTGYLFIWFVWR